ncbi:MAG: helix-hairpin-helix domain-containing protein [Gemmatimonadaceae bacterium]
MPTTAERQALAFIAGVALLGGGARAWSYYESNQLAAAVNGAVVGASTETVADQLAAIDSVRSSKKGVRGKGRGATKSNSSIGGGSNNSPRKRKNDGKLEPPIGRSASEGLRGADIVVDADVATALQLQLLPRVSSALAERIVANRDSLGAFGSLSALGRVRGMSADIRNAIRNLVVFTGDPSVTSPRVPRTRTDAQAEAPSRSRARERVVISRTKKRR